jgi:hypothetical protein
VAATEIEITRSTKGRHPKKIPVLHGVEFLAISRPSQAAGSIFNPVKDFNLHGASRHFPFLSSPGMR